MPVQLTVATFNIRNGRAPDRYNHWLLRRRTTARWFRGLNAHVVGLQEVYPFQRRYLSRRWPGASVAGRGRGAGGGGGGGRGGVVAGGGGGSRCRCSCTGRS